jgi:hypothetical protein
MAPIISSLLMVSPINKAPFWPDYYQPTEDFCGTAALGYGDWVGFSLKNASKLKHKARELVVNG